MDWKKYVKKTAFAKDTDRILNAFRVGKIVTYQDLQNAPVRLGAKIAGYDTYQLIAQLNEVIAAEQSAEVPPVAAPAAASAEEPAKAEEGTEQVDKEAPAKKRSGRRAKAGAEEEAE